MNDMIIQAHVTTMVFSNTILKVFCIFPAHSNVCAPIHCSLCSFSTRKVCNLYLSEQTCHLILVCEDDLDESRRTAGRERVNFLFQKLL